MLIPIGTDLPLKRHPTVTYVIIAVNLLIFAVQWSINRNGGTESTNIVVQDISQFMDSCVLSTVQFQFSALFTYQFLHASWIHLIGNMLFLLPFGKAIEDRLGHMGFLFLYLISGAIGGAMYVAMSEGTVIGASGSVCAVTAAFVVLAPGSRIKVLLVFFIIGMYELPSMLFVLFFVLFDSFGLLANYAGGDSSNTAYVVHFAGYIAGFSITIALTALGFVARTEYDLLYMLRQSKRRRSYKKIVSNLPEHTVETTQKEDPLSLLIASITQVSTGDPHTAANQYLEALQTEPSLYLNAKTQLLIGSTLMKSGRVEDGAKVYEMYLKKHSKADDVGEVALLLVAKYVRELKNEERARELLHEFSSAFSEPHQSLVATLTRELEH